jgi:hypothetical protein
MKVMKQLMMGIIQIAAEMDREMGRWMDRG